MILLIPSLITNEGNQQIKKLKSCANAPLVLEPCFVVDSTVQPFQRNRSVIYSHKLLFDLILAYSLFQKNNNNTLYNSSTKIKPSIVYYRRRYERRQQRETLRVVESALPLSAALAKRKVIGRLPAMAEAFLKWGGGPKPMTRSSTTKEGSGVARKEGGV